MLHTWANKATGARGALKYETELMVKDPSKRSRDQAFQDLFYKEVDYVWASFRKLGVQEQDIDDLVSELFISVYEKQNLYDPTRSLKAWLFGFAFRISSHYRRSPRFRKELSFSVDDLEQMEGSHAEPSPHEFLEKKEAWELVNRALLELTEEKRAVFIMFEMDGIAAQEIAEVLNIPLNTVYSRLRHAKEEFQSYICRIHKNEKEAHERLTRSKL